MTWSAEKSHTLFWEKSILPLPEIIPIYIFQLSSAEATHLRIVHHPVASDQLVPPSLTQRRSQPWLGLTGTRSSPA